MAKKLLIQNNSIKYFHEKYFREVMLSYMLYLIRQTIPTISALKMANDMLGEFYNIKNFTGFVISRAKVKFHPVEKF